MTFQSYSLLSVATAVGMVFHAVQKQEGSFFNTVVYLTSQKINLLIFFNFFTVILINMASVLIWLFFDQIRTIESKVSRADDALSFQKPRVYAIQYLMDKAQKKIFHFLLLTLILKSTFDVYKFLSLSVLFGFWVIHWLVYKRSDYLVSRGSRTAKDHARLLALYTGLIGIDFVITYAFYDRFQTAGEKMNEIYVIIGFEFVRLLLKAVQDNFKYTISLVELYLREQWTEKGFVFNIVSFLFDFTVLLLNIKLFMYILSRHQFPLYLLGEIIDTFVRLGKSIQLFIQARSLINKLKRLPDVHAPEDLPPGVDNTCIICLEEIKQAKKLKCGHIFHLNCLRRWLEQNVQCPTCRDKIELDFTAAATVQRDLGNFGARDRDQRQQELNRRRAARLARIIEAQNAENVPVAQQQQQPEVPQAQAVPLTEVLQPQPVNLEQSPMAENKIQEEDTAEKQRAARLSKFKRLTQQELQEADRVLGQITQELEKVIQSEQQRQEDEEEKKGYHLADKTKLEPQPPVIQQKKPEDTSKTGRFKDIFDVDEEIIMEMLEDAGAAGISSTKRILDGSSDDDENMPKDLSLSLNEEEEDGVDLLEINEEEKYDLEENINKALFELRKEDGKESKTQAKEAINYLFEVPPAFNPYTMRVGSVPYGLPCIAMTRRTFQTAYKNKQIEKINLRLCKVLKNPGEYVSYD